MGGQIAGEVDLVSKVTSGQENIDSDTDSSIKEGQASIKLSPDNTAMGRLENGRKLIIMMDSGSTDSLVSINFVQRHYCLRELPKEALNKPVRLTVANGDQVTTTHRVKFNVVIQGKEIAINALILPQDFGTTSLIIGSDDLSMHKAVLDFSTHKLFVKAKSPKNCMKLQTQVVLAPHAAKKVCIYGRVPKPFKGHDIVIRATGLGKRYMLDRQLVKLSGSNCYVMLANESSKKIIIPRGTILANLDYRSCFDIYDNVIEMGVTPERTVMYVQGDSSWDLPDCQSELQPPLYRDTDRSPKDTTPSTREQIRQYNLERYPFIEEDDPKLYQTEEQILKEEINLTQNCLLTEKQRDKFFRILVKHQDAFSCYGEIGNSDHEVKLPLKDEEPRYLRPYYASPDEKKLIDRELRRLELMGIIKEGLSSFTSPIMLIAKKDATAKKRLVIDLRALNEKIVKLNYPYGIVEESLEQIGEQRPKVLSCIDIKDAFFSIKLHKDSHKWTGISAYHSAKPYYFVRLCQGLSISPSYFSAYINQVLSEIPNSQSFLLNYMDDIICFSKNQTEHMKHIKLVLEALEKHKLKISPKKSHFFRKLVPYLGHNIEIIKGKPYVTVQQSKIEAIKRLQVPRTLKQIRGFCGAVNYVAKFIPNLCEILRPIRKLTRKNTKYKWDEECQKSFESVKEILCKAPVLALPTKEGLIRLYIDTSRDGTGCTIYQTDPDDPAREYLLGYYSCSLPGPAARYSSTELEAVGITQCLKGLKFLRSRYFHVITDHSALVHLMKSKNELPTNRLKKSFEKLSDFHFDMYYKKGAEMVVCDYLSRAEYCSNKEVSDDVNYPEDKTVFVTTRGQAKGQGLQVPEIKESIKELTKAEKKRKRKKIADPGDLTPITEVTEPESSQVEDYDRPTGVKDADSDLNTTGVTADLSDILQPSIHSPGLEGADGSRQPRTSTPIKALSHDNITGRPTLLDLTQIPDPPTNPLGTEQVAANQLDPRDPELTPYIKNNTLVGRGVNIPLDNVPVPKGTLIPLLDQRTKDQGEMFDTYMPPTGQEFAVPTDLFEDVLKHDITTRRIPNQMELEKFLSQVRQRSLRDFSVPLKRQEISQQQRRDPYFKDIWHYIDAGILPGNKRKAKNVRQNAEDYVMVKQILFKIIENKNHTDYRMVLAIPEESVPYILAMEHDTLFSGHKGITKSYYTIKARYFIHKLYDKLVQYIQTCATCQMRKVPNLNTPQHEYIPRTKASFKVMDEIFADVKYLAESSDGYKYLLVLVDQATRFTMAYPLKRITAAAVAEIILQKVCLFFGPFSTITFDEGRENANKIMAYLTRALGIQMRFVCVGHHESNLSERSIQSITNLLISRLEGQGRMWPMYVNSVTYSLNTAQHSVLKGFSAHELVFGRKPKDFLNLELDAGLDLIPVSYRDYAYSIKNRLKEIGRVANDLHNEYQEKQRLDRAQKVKIAPPYAVGDLCWLLMPSHSELNTAAQKIKANFIGPLLVSEIVDDRNLCLQDLSGRNLHGLFNIKRLKRAYFRTTSGTATNISQVKNAVELMDAQKLENPSLKVEARGMMCMADNKQPPPHDLNDYVRAEQSGEKLNPFYDVQLTSYFCHGENSNVAILRHRTPKQIKIENSREKKMPCQGQEMIVTKAKFKLGDLHLFCRIQDGYGEWFHLSSFIPKATTLQIESVLNSDQEPTGRILVKLPTILADTGKQTSIKVQGSMLKFARQLNAKPSIENGQGQAKVKKVRFNLADESTQ